MTLDIDEEVEDAISRTETFRSLFDTQDEWYIWIGREYDQDDRDLTLHYHIDTDESYSRVGKDLSFDVSAIDEMIDQHGLERDEEKNEMSSAHFEVTYPYEDLDEDEAEEVYQEWIEEINEEYPDIVVLSD